MTTIILIIIALILAALDLIGVPSRIPLTTLAVILLAIALLVERYGLCLRC